MWRFLDILFPPRSDEAALRGISTDEFLGLVAPRLVSDTRPGTAALLSYADSRVRAAIHEAKYHGNERAFELLSLVLADYLRESDDIYRNRTSLIIPVPLGTARRKERGFNQVEEVARRAARELNLTVNASLLVRTRETVSQVSLPREKREENMRNAFRATHSIDPKHTYVLLDDVITTGATLQAAIDALREAGAEHIVPLALAH